MDVILIILCTLYLILLAVTYICYRMAFYMPRRPAPDPDKIEIPKGRIYEVYREDMERWTREMRAMPCTCITIESFDGLTLAGKFYEYAPGAPIELMFHGYRGTAERDLSGGVQRCFQLGHSALIVDQRCSGNSGGHTITFGIREHRDCLKWAEYIHTHLGKEIPVILCGISMGAATVLLAAGKPLPENVVGVLADCGYSSARDIIRTVIGQMGLPVKVAYPFVRLGATLFGNFDLEEISPEQTMENCSLPVIFFHGEDDRFVPCQMSRINYQACAARKKLVTVPGAGHGLSYLVDPQLYLSALREFFGPSLCKME